MVRILLATLMLTVCLPARAFELGRWMGTWREIAHLPNRPQAGCADTAVHYALDGRGGFELSNTCWKGDAFKDYRGRAAATDDPRRFRVRFFFFLRSDYWIVEHDPLYRWAAVGTTDRKQLWINARERELPSAEYDRLTAAAKELGFPVERLQRTILKGRPDTL